MALEIESHRNGPGKYQFWRLVGFPNPTDWIRLSPVSKCHFPRWISVHFPVQFYQTNSNQFPSEAALKRSNPLCPNRIESIESNLFIIIIIFFPLLFSSWEIFLFSDFLFLLFCGSVRIALTDAAEAQRVSSPRDLPRFTRRKHRPSDCASLLRPSNTQTQTHTHTRTHTHTHTHTQRFEI